MEKDEDTWQTSRWTWELEEAGYWPEGFEWEKAPESRKGKMRMSMRGSINLIGYLNAMIKSKDNTKE
jgi:hypothetical protein